MNLFIYLFYYYFSIKTFTGPQAESDVDIIIHHLRHPIEANNIRLRPLKWEQLICLRLEFYGCVIEGSPGRKEVKKKFT